MKSVNAAVLAMSQEQIKELETAGQIVLDVEGQPTTVEAVDVEIISEDIPGWTIAQEGSITVALDIEITPELKTEGDSRLIIKRIQAVRKETGLEITDRINVVIEKTEATEKAVSVFGEHIKAQVLANSLTVGDVVDGQAAELGDETVKISVQKA